MRLLSGQNTTFDNISLSKDQYNKLKEMRNHGMWGKAGRWEKRTEGKETAAEQGDND